MLILFGGLAVGLAVSIPVFVVLGATGAFALFTAGIPLISVPQNLFEALDSFALMSIPFYVLAGNLMQTGGISQRLINLANAMLGWARGGLGSASILTCMFFSTISGSSSATTAAVGATMIPAMEKKGYPRNFAAAAVAVGGELGVIIPPSMAMIVYGLIANVSIANLFIAGIIPGVLIGVSLMITIVIVARVRGFDEVQTIALGQWARNVVIALKDAWLALLMPVIILGGIYSGIFTPTEASVVAVVYGFIVGYFVYGEIKLADIEKMLIESSVMTGTVMLVVAFAALYASALTMFQVPQYFAELIGTVATSALMFLLLANVLLFVAGTFMEALATIIILGPILAPIAAQYGIDPVHFGMVMIVNVAIGMITPPVAVNLFIAARIANLPADALIRPLCLFLAVLIVDVLLITYLPFLSLALL